MKIISLNHGLNGFEDSTDSESVESKNPWNPRPQRESVIQTEKCENLEFN